MKIDIKFIALLAIVCLLSLSAVSAADDAQADVTADTNDDIEIGDADTATNDTAASKVKTLERAANGVVINVADGDTIELDDDYELDKSIWINNKITLDGKGHTIDGKNSTRLVVTNTTDVILQNIVFKNGKAIQSTGKADSGAGILAKKGGITLINCTFISNKATDNGGAFYTEFGGNNIINCTFEDNTAAKTGGAIQINGNDNVIKNCIFTNNKATSTNGGAIAFAGSANNNNKITNNIFNGNSAGGDGGAIYLQYGNNNQVNDNKFIKNTYKP